MRTRNTHRRLLVLLCVVMGAGLGLLAGCSSAEDTASTLLVAPGGFDFYSCPQLVDTVNSLRARKLELEKLMARAETDVGGKVMSAMGYRPDYLRVIGQLKSAEATFREKQCQMPPPAAAAPAPAPKTKPAAKRPKR